MISGRTLLFSGAVGVAVLLGPSCGALGTGADESATTTTAPSTTTTAPTTTSTSAPTTSESTTTTESTTTSAAGLDRVVGNRITDSLGVFVVEWDQLNLLLNSGNPDIERIAVAEGDFLIATSAVGDGVFVSQITETAILGGLTDPSSGAVVSVLIAVDPDGETAAPAVLTTVGVTGDPDDSFGALTQSYREVADGPIGGQTYVVSGDNDFSIEKVEGAEADDPLILVTIAPTTDEVTAREMAAVTQQAVFSALVDG